MKKLLLLSIILVCFAGLASASIVFATPCSVLEGPNSGSNNSGICSITADAGDFINSITVSITSDFTGYQSGSPTVTDVYTWVLNPGGAFGLIPNGVVVTNGTNSTPVTNFPSTMVTGNFGSFVQLQFAMSNTVSGGAVTGTSGVMNILGATESGIVAPEPATLGLVGSALLGLGFISRKKKKKA